jgi:general secretion pathway protein K
MRRAPRRQRGVALIAAVLVVALAVVLVAAMLDRGEVARARARNALRAEQGWQLMLGLEGWAASALKRDRDQGGGIDSRDDAWAAPLPPIDLPEARIQGRLREIGGCFDINSLVAGTQDDALAYERLERLLRVLKLDPAIAAQAADWVDVDAQPRSGGAEDLALQARRPAYRAANRAMAHVSELRLLPAVTAKAYETLRPHVCALPAPAPLNLNTASDALWMSLSDAIRGNDAKILARDGHARYANVEAVAAELERLGIAAPDLRGLGVTSDWFVAEADIEADGVPFRYSSLLHRAPEGVVVVARARGSY